MKRSPGGLGRRGGSAGAGPVLSSSAIVDTAPEVRRNLIIEGRIDSEVPLHAHGVVIGPTGRVRGDISAATIRVEGEVVGDLFGEVEVRVCSCASVRGCVTAPRVIVEDGAGIEGRIVVEEGLAGEGPAVDAPDQALVSV